MHMKSNKGTDHSKPAKRLGKWTRTCRSQAWAYPVRFMFGVLIYSPSRWLLRVCLQNSDFGTSFSLYGRFPTLDTPHTDPYIFWWAYKSLVQTFKLQGFQTTTMTLSSQPVQINYCRLQSWVFVKSKQTCRAPESAVLHYHDSQLPAALRGRAMPSWDSLPTSSPLTSSEDADPAGP